MFLFRKIHCTHAAYGTVTLYESSWWPVGTHHHELSERVTVPYAACVQFILLKMSIYGSKHVEE